LVFSVYPRPIITVTNMELDGSLKTNEDEELTIDYTITYSPYPDNIVESRKSFNTDADWLSDSYNANNFKGKVSGTPVNDHVGDFMFNITTRDSAGEETKWEVEIEVLNVNDNPRIINEDVPSIYEDELYSYTYYAIDVDPVLTEFTWNMRSGAFNIPGASQWLTIESNTLFCTISGTPPGAYIGDWWVNISVRDDQGGLDFTNFTLTVESSNDAPVIQLDPVPPAFEDKLYTFDLRAYDEDDANHTLDWEKIHGPSWLQLIQPSRNMPAQLRGIPNNDEIGTEGVEIKVSDALGASARIGFILRVTNTNDAPEWIQVPSDMNATEGDVLLMEAYADDVDLGYTLTYGITSDPESSIEINTESGAIKWLSAEIGNFTINVTVTDGEVMIWHLFNINVSEVPEVVAPDNIVPILANISDQEIDEGKTLTVQITASDEDGDPIFFSVVDGPDGMVISSDGMLVWTPFEEDIGNHTIIVRVTDGNGSATKTFKIWVKDVPDTTDPNGSTTNGSEKGEDTTPLFIVIGILAALLLLMIILFLLFVLRKKDKKEEKEPEKEEPEEEKEEDKEDEMLASLKPEKKNGIKKKGKDLDLEPKVEKPALEPAEVDGSKSEDLLPAPKPVEPEVGALPPSKDDDISMAPEPKLEEDIKSEGVEEKVPEVEEKTDTPGTIPEPVKSEEKAEQLSLPSPKSDN